MHVSALERRLARTSGSGSAASNRLRSDDAAWDAFVAGSAAPSFLQTTAWADVKRPNGWQAARVVAGSAEGPVGAQLLVRRLPVPGLRPGFGYAARGPVTALPLDAALLSAFTAAIRDEATRTGADVVRIDPEVEDRDGSIATALRQLGWRPAGEVQPAISRVLDLTAGEASLWRDIHRKWRQSIRKAARDGTRVVEAGRERLDEFHRIHAETMARVGLAPRSEASFRTLYDAFDGAGRAHLLFTESPDGEVTATILLLGWGDRVVDLYGGTTMTGRRRRANYLIKWEAIRRSIDLGYRHYDLWGLPSERVAAFKSGWGGREVHYVGAWELVLDPLGRTVFEVAIRARSTWLRLLRGRHPGGAAPADEAA